MSMPRAGVLSPRLSSCAAPAFPVNLAYLTRRSDGTLFWFVRRCKFCGGRHIHGAGGELESPTSFLGHRAAYCVESGYLLVDGDPVMTERLIFGRRLEREHHEQVVPTVWRGRRLVTRG